ncbi:MAG TPA: hypothetical protein VHT28_07570 [Silvibacterium sp.]|jgi:hypothetical protein|nr:hypothetical protein [Silvibacterium sp.]
MDLDALLTHCRLADGRLVDTGIAGGRIAAIGGDAAPSLSNRVPILDIGGDLVLPRRWSHAPRQDSDRATLGGEYGGAEPDEPHRDRQDDPAISDGLHRGTRR